MTPPGPASSVVLHGGADDGHQVIELVGNHDHLLADFSEQLSVCVNDLSNRALVIAFGDPAKSCLSTIDGLPIEGIVRATGAGGEKQKWTLFAVAFEGLVRQFFEIDPSWQPTESLPEMRTRQPEKLGPLRRCTMPGAPSEGKGRQGMVIDCLGSAAPM